MQPTIPKEPPFEVRQCRPCMRPWGEEGSTESAHHVFSHAISALRLEQHIMTCTHYAMVTSTASKSRQFIYDEHHDKDSQELCLDCLLPATDEVFSSLFTRCAPTVTPSTLCATLQYECNRVPARLVTPPVVRCDDSPHSRIDNIRH